MGCTRRETGRGHPDVVSCGYGGIALSCGGVAISCRWHSDTGKRGDCARANLADGTECEFCPGLTNFGERALSDRWGLAACPAIAQRCGMDLCCGVLDGTPQCGALVGDSSAIIEIKPGTIA